jgi:osmotically-inducible protein OsmY
MSIKHHASSLKGWLVGAVVLAVVAPACGPKTTIEKAGQDQEVARDILAALKADERARFADVNVVSLDKVVTLKGRVSDKQAAQDAANIAMRNARGARVQLQLEVRAR